MRVLLGQLGSNGDCLYATILARQIKADHPDCHLTWAIARQCRHLLDGNPHVDEIWEWDVPDWPAHEAAWRALEIAVLRIQAGPNPFDRVWLSQIWPANFRRYDGTVRPSILRAYDAPITVPIDSVIPLAERDRQQVGDFVRRSGMTQYSHRVLFECSSKSGQSYVTPDFALDVARRVSARMDDVCFVLSTHQPVPTDQSNVICATEIGMRQNAALTHYCTLFVGCGSGLTVVATSSAAKELPNIQLLSASTSVYASFHHDFLHFGKPADRFIEMGDASADQVAGAILRCCTDGPASARAGFHRPLPVTHDFYFQLVDHWLLRFGRYMDALQSLQVTAERYGWNDALLTFGRERLLPNWRADTLAMDPRSRIAVEAALDRLSGPPA